MPATCSGSVEGSSYFRTVGLVFESCYGRITFFALKDILQMFLVEKLPVSCKEASSAGYESKKHG